MRDIGAYLKPGKILVVELEDGVDHAIFDEGVSDIENGKELVRTIRLVDRAPQTVSVRRIMWALDKEDAIDYIDPPRKA